MKNFKIILTATMILGSMAFASGEQNAEHKEGQKHEMKAKMAEVKQAVNSACAADAEKAGCKDAELGKGLMKCLKEYKKTNKDFKVSDECKKAAEGAREIRKEHKKAKEAKK